MESRVIKKTAGRCRIDIKRIADRSRRQVTFTKRHQGLFKKAAEFNILCGADITVFAKSPGGKIYTFTTATPTHCSVRRSLFGGVNDASFDANRIANVRNFGSEKGKGKKMKEGLFWWEREIDEFDELEKFAVALEDLRNRVYVEIEKKQGITGSSSSSAIFPYDTQVMNTSMDGMEMANTDCPFSYPPAVPSLDYGHSDKFPSDMIGTLDFVVALEDFRKRVSMEIENKQGTYVSSSSSSAIPPCNNQVINSGSSSMDPLQMANNDYPPEVPTPEMNGDLDLGSPTSSFGTFDSIWEMLDADFDFGFEIPQ